MKKILILAGGYSNEREISIQTARSVYKELKKRGKSFNHKGFSPCKIYSGLRKTL